MSYFNAEKENISEAIGAVGGGVLGFGTITAAVSASGVVARLGAAGIAADLASIGAISGGGMMAGVSLLAAIPLAAGAVGYGIVKGVKLAIDEHKLNEHQINPKWEIPLSEGEK